MRMQKRKFRIGELAKQLNVERFVIQFWEKEFSLKSTRSGGGQRFYDEKDLELFTQIKSLLYAQGFTITGAKKQLKVNSTPPKQTRIVASQKTTMDDNKSMKELLSAAEKEKKQLEKKIVDLQKQLMKLRELL